jgi:PAS domain S-box-containing protein
MDDRDGDREAESLAEDPAFLRALVDNVSEGLLTIDTDSRILFASPAIEDILGYRPDELVGSSKMTIIPERLQPVHEAALAQYIETGERHIDWTGVELPALHRDGHEVPVSVSLREHRYDGQRLFTGIFRDITEQKRREAELRAQRRDIEEFAHVLSHDLRNPLAVARGFLELIEEDHDIEEVDRVEAALDRVEEIIEDTAASALHGELEGPLEVLTLRDVVQRAWNAVPTAAADLVLPDPAWHVRAHEGRLGQLLENLIRNAVDHGGPAVTVEVGIIDDGTGFYLEDDGPGLPGSVETRLETPSGLSRERESGYGLQIVQSVADEHDWELEVGEATTGGARFEFVGAGVFR